MYERSLGCVGILKNWTRNALADALEEGASTLTRKHLESRALSVGQSRNILKKIKEGEKNYADIEGEVEQLRNELGLGLKPKTRKISACTTTPKTAPKGVKGKSVGQRKGKRDSIGIQ
ncbi:hypothetical protein [Gloeothece citriformis]|uniref:hypothetical protein n=1 Tax=Gloeothece citriformis TaxID=2546356 RepID=UPI000173D5AB|nr:hypothetical protein [Gloeothece citriformis]